MKNYLKNTLNYLQYRKLIDDLMAQGKTTGDNQSADYLNYAKLNHARMQRLDKTTQLTEQIKEQLNKISKQYIWLVLTEGWCGDAAQNIPPLHFMAQHNPNIQLHLLLRDENLELMDKYLTNGGRSIPKLICLEKETLKEIFVWGPRPAEAQNIVTQLLANNATLEEKSNVIQKWYNADKTLSLQNEFIDLLKRLS
jgi:hypothetical protein